MVVEHELANRLRELLSPPSALQSAGGTLVNDRFAPTWWTLADPEGNEVDLATWVGRD